MGSKTPATTTQTTSVQMSPEQKSIFNMAMPYAKEYAAKPIEQFQGTGIAEFNPLEVQAQQTAQAAVPGAKSLTEAGSAAQAKMLDPSFMLDPANNAYLQNAMRANNDETMRGLMETALPGVRAGATSAGGQYSGGATKAGIAEGVAIGRTSDAISNSNTRMLFDAYNRGMAGMQGAIQGNAGVVGASLLPAGIESAVGEQQRSMEQAKLDEQIRQFYTGQQLPFLQAQELMQLIQGMPGGSTTSTATGSTPGVNPGMAGLGGAASGAAIGSTVGMPIAGAGVGGLLSLLMNK